ncbi:hypothetical protein PHAVU_001G051500 [Phaseolus vulgaris]|uniref:Transmembrane protein n=1 Tax=Phaseolus vulgaris TaxID=3885 RepID=V7CV17_PHAVU|nr:hypothetical protein PHAVU_001G051500g [Phaseolus vulgaris]ESW33208.1 hypothetical protein PHAVU_001G051500g [Phaseolus vulgaris]
MVELLLILYHRASPPPSRTCFSSSTTDLLLLLHHGNWFLLPLLSTYSLSHAPIRSTTIVLSGERNTTVITIYFALFFIILSLFPLSISSVGIDFTLSILSTLFLDLCFLAHCVFSR